MLRLFYACYFVTLGVSTPFFPAYLRQLGLSGRAVAALLAIPPALQLGAPFFWGFLADRTRRPQWVLRVLCLGAFLGSLPVIVARSLPALLAATLAQQVFATAIVALADSLAIEKSRQGPSYGGIRAVGSASFIATCLATGAWLDLRAIPGGDRLVPILVSAGYGLSLLAATRLPGQRGGARPHLAEVRALLQDRRFRLLLILAGLHWAALVPYHGFFGVLLQDRGFPAKITSYAFVLGTAAEIAVFLLFSRLRARFALGHLLAAAFAVSAARWWLLSGTRSAVLVVALQIGHGFTFGMFWAGAMAWLAECVPGKLRATGQVLFGMVIGLGGLVSLPLAGALYDATGGASAAFACAGALDLVPLGLLLFSQRAGAAPLPGMRPSPQSEIR
jgi:PPP family 3-phenylpropionic acid transporter